MTSRKALLLAACALGLSVSGHLTGARAQGSQAPFTIRRPPDGSIVREQVRVQIPRASIPPGGFVGFFVDGQFLQAVQPSESTHEEPFFSWVWDTKDLGIPDGEHTIRAVLYASAGAGFNTASATERGASEVRVRVENKIHGGPSLLYLRYKFRDGAALTYGIYAKDYIVGGVSETGTTTSDQDLSADSGKLEMDVYDVSTPSTLVRDKLTSLSYVAGGEETVFDPGQLPNSLYREIDQVGHVLYQTGGSETNELGGVVLTDSLELPLLPSGPVTIGQEWLTPHQALDLPNILKETQPRVTLTNRLVDLEWEGGYPTAKIVQTYTGHPVKEITLGGIPITNPEIHFERDIYLAYKSGTLVKTVKKITYKGQTTAAIGAPPPTQIASGPPNTGGMPGGMMGGGPPGYPGGPPGFPGGAGGKFGNMGGAAGMRGMMGGGPPGYPGGMTGGGPPGFPGGGGGKFGNMAGGRRGMMGGPGGFGGTMGAPPNTPGFPGGTRPGAGNLPPAGAPHEITIRTILSTTLQGHH
ncbi:MAG TPA: hypothetical protein VFA07_01285 [Chthonomonadaceae bacterium]|nr:hypothetical protein [Chthonomonadaceae bacterium]